MAKNELTTQGVAEGGLLSVGVAMVGMGAPLLQNDVSLNAGLALVAIGVIVLMAREVIKNT